MIYRILFIIFLLAASVFLIYDAVKSSKYNKSNRQNIIELNQEIQNTIKEIDDVLEQAKDVDKIIK